MGIERLKYWHWCIIGLIAGAVFASVKLWLGAPEPPGLKVVDLRVFEEQLILRTSESDPGRAVVEIRNVKVHPVGGASFIIPGENNAVHLPYISYEVVLTEKGNPKKAEVLPRNTLPQLGNPKTRGTRRGASLTEFDKKILEVNQAAEQAPVEPNGASLVAYLDKLSALIKDLDKTRYKNALTFTYKKSWWDSSKATYWIYTSGGFIVIGLIFPTLLNLLAVAGYGKLPPEEEGVDLRNYKSHSEPQQAKKEIPANAAEQLAQLEAELEAKLKAGATETPAPAVAAAAPAKPVIKTLTAGKLEAPKPEAEKKSAPKGFGRDRDDYYPTEVHGKSK